MALQSMKELFVKLIREAQKTRTQTKANKAEIEKLKANSGGGLNWKDITATYQTRIWKPTDAGKIVRITMGSDEIIAPISVFLTQGNYFISATSGMANIHNSSMIGYIYQYYQFTNAKNHVAIYNISGKAYIEAKLITKFEIIE